MYETNLWSEMIFECWQGGFKYIGAILMCKMNIHGWVFSIDHKFTTWISNEIVLKKWVNFYDHSYR
jgi:hypothetical protein